MRDAHGYLHQYAPEHPRANMARYVKQHHLVMEQMMGRYLLPGESVHHRNGVKDDNRPENLELWVTTQPAGQRPTDLLEWADEIIRRYRTVPVRFVAGVEATEDLNGYHNRG